MTAESSSPPKHAFFRVIEHDAQVFHKNIHGRQRRVVTLQDVRHAVLKHPGTAGAVRNDFVQGIRIAAGTQAQRHRFGGGGDVHAGQQLVDHLDLRALPRLLAQTVQFGADGIENAGADVKRIGRAGRHHRHFAGSRLGRAA